MVKIRFATLEDKQRIKKFLAEHWSPENILVISDKIFDFQYCWNGKCNFVLAVEEETNEIVGIKGFIPFSQEENPDIAAALAFVKQGQKPLLGMEIQKFLEKETKARYVCSTGLNVKTSYRVYQLFKRDYTVGKLNHFYLLGEENNYYIADIYNKKEVVLREGNYRIKNIVDYASFCTMYDSGDYKEQKPYKSMEYLKSRYFNHPIYQYCYWGISKDDIVAKVDAVIISREVEVDGRKALRIVDILGDYTTLQFIGRELRSKVSELKYEYIDFYNFGIENSILEACGFSLRDDNDSNIIPNYFEPFVKKNVDIHFFYTGSADKLIICKADGDQDRPSILPANWSE